MPDSKPVIYSSRAATEFQFYIEIIEDVFEMMESGKISRHYTEEIGFYFRDKAKKTEYFFGIWYDLWRYTEVPLALTFRYFGKAPNQWHYRVQKYLRDNTEQGLKVVEYEDHTCLIFDASFFKFDDEDFIEKTATAIEKFTLHSDSIANI